MLTVFESRYTLKERYNIGNVDKTASMSMPTLFESRYTLKGRYNIGNAGKTASMSMLLTLLLLVPFSYKLMHHLKPFAIVVLNGKITVYSVDSPNGFEW